MVGTDKTITTFDEEGNLVVKFLETGNEYNIGKWVLVSQKKNFLKLPQKLKYIQMKKETQQ